MKKLILIPFFISTLNAAEIPEGAAQHGLDDYYTSVFLQYWGALDEDSYIYKECTKNISKYYEAYLDCLYGKADLMRERADDSEKPYYNELYDSMLKAMNPHLSE